jgi:[ribosomal protein S18]-alanine N-acetyltransferase
MCLKIRPATLDDVPDLIQLERTASTAAHWSEHQYREVFQAKSSAPRLVLLAHSEDGQVLGFLVAQHVAPEWELENIVVSATERRKGIAWKLLSALIDSARKSADSSIFLEVRESNVLARGFYEKAGFRSIGLRPHYYEQPAEDALVYRLDLR